jgi:hypothetical protein
MGKILEMQWESEGLIKLDDDDCFIIKENFIKYLIYNYK